MSPGVVERGWNTFSGGSIVSRRLGRLRGLGQEGSS